MKTDEFIRIVPGRVIEGVFYHHVEVLDPDDGGWHSVRACADKADAVKVVDRLSRAFERANTQRSREKRR